MNRNIYKVQFFSRSTVRFSIALAIAVAAIIALTGYFSAEMFESFTGLRKQQLKRLVTLGEHSIEPILERYRSGELSQEETLWQVRTQIRQLVYDDPSTRNYLFMSSYDGTMLVQPFNPELEGTDQWDLQDSRGMYIIRELVKTARSGAGYVEYYYPPPDSTHPGRKISYVVGIPELQAYLGTGLYLNDVQTVVAGFLRNGIMTIVAVFLLLSLVLIFLFRPFYTAYYALHKKFSAIAANPSQAPEELYSEMVPSNANSEVGMLMQNFQLMLTQLHHARYKLEKSLQEKQILLKEVHHRVKNNLQIVSSLLKLQASNLADPDQQTVLNESVNRIHSMSLIHEMIFSSDEFNEIEISSYIQKLVYSIFQGFRPEHVQVSLQFEIESDVVDVETAILCGLVINEMVTNALKHAFENQDQGLIIVGYKKKAEHTLFWVQDNGCGADSALLETKLESLGISLILSLVSQLHGKVWLEVSKGSRFLVSLPIEVKKTY